jgi:hypothetical protein
MYVAFLLCWYIKTEFMNNQPHICIRKRSLHNMPMVAHRRIRCTALLILNISTTLGWVNSSMTGLLCSQGSGTIPTVNKAGWARRLVKTGMRQKISCPHQGSNLTVQPVASRYTIYAILSASQQSMLVCVWHTVGEKNHENYTSWRFMWH